MAAARARQDTLTKPPGSLGRLEELSVQIAGITGQAAARVRRQGHHHHGRRPRRGGRGRQRLSRRRSRRRWCYNFLHGGAAINVLARHVGARVVVVDMGVASRFGAASRTWSTSKVAHGTANMARARP